MWVAQWDLSLLSCSSAGVIRTYIDAALGGGACFQHAGLIRQSHGWLFVFILQMNHDNPSQLHSPHPFFLVSSLFSPAVFHSSGLRSSQTNPTSSHADNGKELWCAAVRLRNQHVTYMHPHPSLSISVPKAGREAAIPALVSQPMQTRY